jgi:hypothetical protein
MEGGEPDAGEDTQIGRKSSHQAALSLFIRFPIFLEVAPRNASSEVSMDFDIESALARLGLQLGAPGPTTPPSDRTQSANPVAMGLDTSASFPVRGRSADRSRSLYGGVSSSPRIAIPVAATHGR